MDNALLAIDPSFERENFDSEKYVKKLVAEKIYALDLVDTKEKLSRNAQQTSEEIKQSVYKNYTNFMVSCFLKHFLMLKILKNFQI
jgi:hypothetical protein